MIDGQSPRANYYSDLYDFYSRVNQLCKACKFSHDVDETEMGNRLNRESDRMSDEENHFELKVDTGASKTYPQQAGMIQKNRYIIKKGRPCKVVEKCNCFINFIA
ncbi:uncharacterized protein LOC143849333 [Tasmannia lanceolata]|uniref:uncharacterized protein LOC143849333 n=1 Tax=Tasmannia lanceolata TaxID=3420 RepID=UPI004062E170